MMDYLKTCWKPPEAGFGAFGCVSDLFQYFFCVNFFLIKKKSGNLAKTIKTVSEGFQRFPDNLYLMDYIN